MALATPATGATSAAAVVRQQLTRRSTDVAGIVMLVTLLFTLLVTLAVLATLLGQVVSGARPALAEVGVGDFLSRTIGSSPDTSGIFPGLYGSFFIGLGVILVAVPLGIGAAIYLEEYATNSWFNRFIQVNIRNLAGVPAVVYGVLGLLIFTEYLDVLTGGSTVIAAALTMAVLVLPIVIITSMEAIRAVPSGLRDAGYGVGASRWEVTRDHVLPYAAPGILTGTVLSIARALGEAAPLIILGAITGLLGDTSMRGAFTALPMLIFAWSGRSTPPGAETTWANSAAAAAVVLLVLVMFFNAAAIVLRNRFEKKRTGT
ncbi:MAG: phosphate ABC transporter permease PstA [Ilumatobacteraceae bacterium]|jgi:phosphate transport system permease protein